MNLGTSLEQLDLSGNQLKLIEEETFRPLYGLQVSYPYTQIPRYPYCHIPILPNTHIAILPKEPYRHVAILPNICSLATRSNVFVLCEMMHESMIWFHLFEPIETDRGRDLFDLPSSSSPSHFLAFRRIVWEGKPKKCNDGSQPKGIHFRKIIQRQIFHILNEHTLVGSYNIQLKSSINADTFCLDLWKLVNLLISLWGRHHLSKGE